MIHCHTSDYSLDMMYSTTRESVCVCGGGGGGVTCGQVIYKFSIVSTHIRIYTGDTMIFFYCSVHKCSPRTHMRG